MVASTDLGFSFTLLSHVLGSLRQLLVLPILVMCSKRYYSDSAALRTELVLVEQTL